MVDGLVYRDLRMTLEATDDDNNAEKPCGFLGATCDVMDSEVDTQTGSGVCVIQDDGSDGEN